MTQQQLTPEQQAEVDKQVAARLAAAMAGSNGNGHANGNGQAQNPMAGWNQQPMGMQPSMMQPAGGVGVPSTPDAVLVPIELNTPDGGSVRMYLSFGGQHATPQGIMTLLQTLMMQGIPVKAYYPKQRWGGNGGGGWNGSGGGGGYNGYGNGGGGRGGYGRRF